jgi:hypothetical protein
VENDNILFVTNGKSIKDDSTLGWIRTALIQTGKAKVHTLCMADESISVEESAKLTAEARYLIVCTPIHIYSGTKFREGTEEVLLCTSPFHLYNQGLQTNYRLKWHRKYMQLVSHNDISVLQLPSDSVEQTYRKSYAPQGNVKCDLYGCCLTDRYGKEEFAEKSKEKLLNIFPEAAGKKVIFYAPAVKTRTDCPEWLDLLELDILQRLIGDKYVVVLNLNKSQLKNIHFKNKLNIPGFSKWIKRRMTPWELMACSDIIVGDYRDIFYQAPFFHKPTYSTASDYERQYMLSPNLTMNKEKFREFLFCPVVNSSIELAQELEKVESYDFHPMEKFRNEWMNQCDGNSVQRVVEYLLRGIEKR